MKKKILHILVLPKMAGSQAIALEIIKSLPNDEYDKYIMFSDTEDCGDRIDCVNKFQSADSKVIFSKKLKREIGIHDISAIIEIYKLCKKEKFDIVHTHSTKPGIIGRFAATLARVPLVIHTVHGLAFHQFIKFPKWQFYWMCEMFASLFCHKIILVNRYYKKYFKWLGNKVSTIYNGVDFAKFEQPATIRENKSDDLKILFVGRLEVQKNPMMLLQVAKIIIKKYPSVIFSIVGDGDLFPQCKSYIQVNCLENNVKLWGWQNDVSTFYQTHDIFVMPSIYESFGLIFLEAGYYSLPTVATNVEGIPEVIEDKYSGLLSNPNDIDAFANNMIRLIEDKNFRVRMGKNAHKRVIDKFNVNMMTSLYRQAYKNN